MEWSARGRLANRGRALSGVVALLVGSASSAGWAAGPLPADGEPIATSDYRIDMYQGPILSSSRSTGLAGSTAAIAEGVDGLMVNAAAPAVRPLWSVDYYDYDWGIGFLTASTLEETDFDNNGRVRFEDGTDGGSTPHQRFFFATVGATFQWGTWGVGVNVNSQSYRLGETPVVAGAPPNLSVNLHRVDLLLARASLDRTFLVGAGMRGASLALNATENVNGSGEKVKLVEMDGAGLQAGVLFTPQSLPLRVGVTWRSVVRGRAKQAGSASTTAEGDTLIGSRYLPSEIVMPWELEAGIAYQFGARPLNMPWVDPHEHVERFEQRLRDRRKPDDPDRVEEMSEAYQQRLRRKLAARYDRLPRQKVLVTASVLISGRVDDAVGVESFLRQRVERSGRWLTVQPRLGVEVEPIAHRLQLRAGTYVEPSRFDQQIIRVHGTGGFDLRVFEWSVFSLFDEDTAWRVGGSVDGAQRYLSVGVTAGIWH